VDALMAADQAECTGHTDLAGEFRELGRTALDRLEPWLARVREHAAAGSAADGAATSEGGVTSEGERAATGEPVPAACAVCPVCAVIALIRGERSELAVRLSDQAAGLVSVLRTALDEGNAAPASADPASPSGPADPQPGGQRAVQHIAVVRADPSPG